MAWTQQQTDQYLSDNPDVAAAIRAGTMDSALGHFTRHGSTEGRSAPGTTPGTSVSAPPQPAPQQVVDDPPAPRYPSLYNEMRGTGLGGPDVDYTNSPVSTAPFQNAHHYIGPDGDPSRLIDAIKAGQVRFNPDNYAFRYSDLAEAGIDTADELVEHYATHGWREGRAPGVDAPIYVNGTQTQEQAAAGVDPIADALRAMGQTPNWESSGTGLGSGLTGGTQSASTADEIRNEIDQILNDNVQDNIAQVYAEDSPLMRLAAGRALQVANSRGMLNSTMAETAAQDAVLNVAMPIGSQQASQNWQTNENQRAFDHQTDLLTQELNWRGDQAGLDRQHQITQQDREIGFRSAEASLDRELQERLQTWNLNATEADNAARQAYSAQTLLQNTLVNINANTNLTAQQRSDQIAQARADFDMAMFLVEQIYRVDLNWADAA
ncbi:hypothetical protein [Roseibium sp.]|uniref:hypothetical protein n=1 Tax=Roseibium sp. TaxID=1936156 RepID=UPI003B51E1ED